MRICIITIITLLITTASYSQNQQAENLVIITIDGLRWQEVFRGATDSLMNDLEYVKDTTELQERFAAATPEERRQLLMPWFWSTLTTSGQLYGNRSYSNKVNVTNRFRVSYPGYSEILTGYADSRITSNAKVWNPEPTVLEWINNLPAYNGRVAAFASWDVFPYIINEERSGIPVNAGFRTATGNDLSWKEHYLNELMPTVPSPWSSVRLDFFTHNYCLEYMKRKHPKVVYISYGETDDFAHDGRYDHYLKSAFQTDQWIKALWEYVQSDPFYAGKTAFIITTDHGRGTSPKDEWRSHGSIFRESDQIWIGAIGPAIQPIGEVKTAGQWWQNQIAKTAAALIGLDYQHKEGAGEIIPEILNK